jgi:beta-lactamase superfamily II metal-dependent hydrolase
MRLRKLGRWLAFLLVLALCLGLAGCGNANANRHTHLMVTIVDVADGDCILITEPNGRAMMIDTGRSEYRDRVKAALREAGVKALDVLLLTHPHNDHIGNAKWILEHYPVAEVHRIDREHNTDTFRKLTAYLANTNVVVKNVRRGDTFTFGEAKCRYLGPQNVDTPELNNASAVLKMEYRGTSFLFMGDAEWTAESLLMLADIDALDADVLKVGHHGLHSTSVAFLKAVTPGVAAVSMDDLKNSTSPKSHRGTLDAIAGLAQLFRTDIHGHITILSDGKTVSVQTQKRP